MAPKTIQGWSLTEDSRGDNEPVWRLKKTGRRIITLRFEKGIDDKAALKYATNAIALADEDGRTKTTED